MDFFTNIINSSLFFYIAVAILYILIIVLVIFLLVKNKKKKICIQKNNLEQKKDAEAVDLEFVLEKMQEDVNKTKNEVKTFEEEQEEKAIISYQELLKAVKKDVNEVTNESEEVNAAGTLEPVVLVEETIDNLSKDVDSEKNTKFQNSEFISPIYGRVNNEIEYPKIKSFKEQESANIGEDLEKTIVFDPINDINNDDFLKALKEFRNNLE